MVLALAAVALGALIAAGWYLRTRPRRPEPGPATFDFGPEPPAVVDLLTGDFVVEHDAVVATLVDLAARGRLDIEEVAGGNVLIRRRRDPKGDDRTTAYEDRLLGHVDDLAVDGQLPAERLTTGPAAASGRWFRGFVREVTADARDRGLCVRRWGLRVLAWIWGSALVAAGAVALLLATADRDPAGTGRSIDNLLAIGCVLGAGALLALAARLTASDAQRDTDAGLARAGYWLGVRAQLEQNPDLARKPAASVALWDRLLAYATALGLAPTVLRQLPLGTEHDRRAWSRATGSWRPVRVRYPRLRPGWGQAPWTALLTGLIQAAFAGALAYAGLIVARGDLDALGDLDPEVRDWVTLGGMVAAALLVPVILGVAAKAVLGLVDLFPRRTVEGDVLRRRVTRTGDWLPRPLRWVLWSGRDEHGQRRDAQRKARRWLAVDDGTGQEVAAWRVRPGIHATARQGDTVRARVSPRLGYVADVEVLARPASTDPSVLPGAAEEALDVATARLGGLVERAAGSLAALETMTDGEGRPVLDRTDDEGVPLRDRLSEARGRLDDADWDRLARSLPRRGGGASALDGLDGLFDALKGRDGDRGPGTDEEDGAGP